MKTIAILGTVGIPAAYGGFETLAENLARFHYDNGLPEKLVVYCSAKSYPLRSPSYLGAKLQYIGLGANGASSIFYDALSLLSAARRRSDVILLLGVSGAVVLPLLRLLSPVRIVTNVDGIEWGREKWKGPARWFLRFSERMAVRFSHEVIADNVGIAEHISHRYKRDCHVIAYGGDHAVEVPQRPVEGVSIPTYYALALCRIEPENNVDIILEGFAQQADVPLVFIGNWGNSEFGRMLRARYRQHPNLHLLDPIYDLGVLHTLRRNASVYVHGHSAGGTNPSLVEMMHFGVPILAYDCVFNRYTTDEMAPLFTDTASLGAALAALTPSSMEKIGSDMKRLALERYTWHEIGKAYFRILLETNSQRAF